MAYPAANGDAYAMLWVNRKTSVSKHLAIPFVEAVRCRR